MSKEFDIMGDSLADTLVRARLSRESIMASLVNMMDIVLKTAEESKKDLNESDMKEINDILLHFSIAINVVEASDDKTFFTSVTKTLKELLEGINKSKESKEPKKILH